MVLGSGEIRIQRVLCTLGLSVFPDWELAFHRSFDLLESGGIYVVLDLFDDSRTFETRLVNRIAGSDISRRTWEPLSQVSDDYAEDWHPIHHGGQVVVASGMRPHT